MPEIVNITVENKLITEKRDINVYHHFSRGAHIISFNSLLTLPLRAVEENDYLHISVSRGPGNLWNESVLSVPSWADFEFVSEGKVTITHAGAGTVIKIPPGPPTWQLKMTRHSEMSPEDPSADGNNSVAVGDSKSMKIP